MDQRLNRQLALFAGQVGDVQAFFSQVFRLMSSVSGAHVQASGPHLNAGVAAQVEVELGGVRDGAVHRGACWDVATLPHLQGAGQAT